MNTNIDTDKTEKMKKQAEVKLDGFAQDFTKNVKAYSSDAADSITEGYDTALSWVKKNPLQAAAIGAGVGFLIGFAIRRLGSEKRHG
jgi:ElaB/YqjD/DUF883 family membrane-anchored ribosome-binding protein